jgi:GTP-binding protein EngB required for normal cell division
LRTELKQAVAKSPQPPLVVGGCTQMLLIGDRGAGKSSYINAVATALAGYQKTPAPYGTDRENFTQHEWHWRLPGEYSNIVMYDTPGKAFKVCVLAIVIDRRCADCHNPADSWADGHTACVRHVK